MLKLKLDFEPISEYLADEASPLQRDALRVSNGLHRLDRDLQLILDAVIEMIDDCETFEQENYLIAIKGLIEELYEMQTMR